MLQKPKNKRSGNGVSSASLKKREALLAKKEASLAKREASLAKREACLSGKVSGSIKRRGPARFLDKDGKEISFAEFMRQSPLYGLDLDFGRR